jgi:hypothetical protein
MELIDKELGMRGKRGNYSCGKIIQTWMNIFFCGGECAENIQEHLRTSLELIHGIKYRVPHKKREPLKTSQKEIPIYPNFFLRI